MGTAGGSLQLESPQPYRRFVGVHQEISEIKSKGTDQGFRSFGGFGVEYFQREDGVSERKG